MDPVDLNSLIERAKDSARSVGIGVPNSGPPIKKEGSEVEELINRVDILIDEEELEEQLKKEATAERGRHLVMAKLLAAADVFSEVSR